MHGHLTSNYLACDQIFLVHTAHGPADSEGSAVWSSTERTISCTTSKSNINFTGTIIVNHKSSCWNTDECVLTDYVPLHYKNNF